MKHIKKIYQESNALHLLVNYMLDNTPVPSVIFSTMINELLAICVNNCINQLSINPKSIESEDVSVILSTYIDDHIFNEIILDVIELLRKINDDLIGLILMELGTHISVETSYSMNRYIILDMYDIHPIKRINNGSFK